MERVLRNRAGLTLVELLVALVVLGVILGAMFAATKAMVHAWATGQHRVGVQQNGRNAIEWVTRRIRTAGVGWNVTNGSIYTAAEDGRIRFRADLGAGLRQYEYLRVDSQLVEQVYDSTGRSLLSRRPLTAPEEVGIITVADLNFCYYDIFNTLLNGPRDSEGRCTRSVADLGSIYRVQMRLRIVSGRPGEDPITLYSQAFTRAQEMP
jgi:prepilin-type N-terminal cleavage/methylation domain-containing protein